MTDKLNAKQRYTLYLTGMILFFIVAITLIQAVAK